MIFANSTLRVSGTWPITSMQRVGKERLMKLNVAVATRSKQRVATASVATNILPVAKCGDEVTICPPLMGLLLHCGILTHTSESACR